MFRGGEDSSDGSDTFLIVADGVGGWAMQGIDPGFFSRKLTTDAVQSQLDEPYKSPLYAMDKGCNSAGAAF